MTNTKMLEKKIDESGYKRSYIAKELGLSTYGLSLKIRNVNEFKASEIDKLCVLIGITDINERCAIFFAQ